MDAFGRISGTGKAGGPRLEFRKPKLSQPKLSQPKLSQPKPRSYRELAADGQLDLELATGWTSVEPRDWPAGRPRRDLAGADARRAQLSGSWRRLRELVVAELTDFSAYVWIEPCELVDVAGDVLFVAAPSHVRGWVRERYGDLFRDAARELAGRALEVVFVAPYAESPCAPEAIAA